MAKMSYVLISNVYDRRNNIELKQNVAPMKNYAMFTGNNRASLKLEVGPTS